MRLSALPIALALAACTGPHATLDGGNDAEVAQDAADIRLDAGDAAVVLDASRGDAGSDAGSDGGCAHDLDGDGDRAIACGGLDCDDTDPLRSSLRDEICNGADDDCDGDLDEDLFCTCPAETWDHDASAETDCVAWSDCGPGEHVGLTGTSTRDRTCVACEDETFSATQNAASCTPWTTCTPGSYVAGASSAVADRACAPCPEGLTTTISNATDCVPRSTDCDPGEVRLGPSTCAWLHQFGALWSDFAYSADHAYAVSADASGSVVVAGLTYGAFPGSSRPPTNGDAFVRRYDATGAELWTRQFGTGGADRITASATDGMGRIFVAGYVNGALPGLAHVGTFDAFVRAYDPDGNELWTRQLGSVSFDTAQAIGVDPDGNVLLAGWTGGSLPGQTNAGLDDAFVRKYDPDGNELWTRQFGSSLRDSANAITADGAGNVVVVGHVGRALPGLVSAGAGDVFVRKYDRDGTELWTRQFGSIQSDLGHAVAVDASGNIFVAGVAGRALPEQVWIGADDAFVRAYDAGGTELWTRQFGTSAPDAARALTLTARGHVRVAGHVEGALPGQTSAGGNDAFVREYDTAGTELRTLQLGTSDGDRIYACDVGAIDHLFCAGDTLGTLEGQTSAGGFDAFVVRMRP